MTRIAGYQDEDYIETGSGIKFHFLNPTADQIGILDIASALSKQCRYSGHVKRFYSVAEHCCLMYDHATTMTIEDDLLRTILMHDASEAYLTDIARPIKNHLPDYAVLEKRIEEVIATKFNLIYPFPDTLKTLDTRILLDERAQAMHPTDNIWAVDKTKLKPLGVNLRFMNPEQAFMEFMYRYDMVKHG